MFHLPVVDDNKNTAFYFKTILEEAGYSVETVHNGSNAFNIIEKKHIDLVLLDIMMPGLSGYEILKSLRDTGCTIPVILVTAKQLPSDKYKGFNAGADDYITKPVDENELLLRIKALLRRANTVSEKKLFVNGVVLDYDSLTVSFSGKSLSLPKKEFYLLYKLLSFPNHVFTRVQLMDEIRGVESDSSDNTINVHINRLRKKLSDCDAFEITAIRGIGYKGVIKK